MDAFIRDNLPYAYTLYNQYYVPYSSQLAPIYATLLHYQSLYFRFVYPAIYPLWRLCNYAFRQLLSNVTNASTTSPSSNALISFIGLAILFVISLKVLNFLRRQVMWWISLFTTIVTWTTLGIGGWYVYNRGLEQSIEDIAYLTGLVMGWSQEGTAQGGRLASEREWDAERMRRQSGGRGPNRRTRGGGW